MIGKHTAIWCQRIVLHAVIILQMQIVEIIGLRGMRMRAPQGVLVGGIAVLQCDYDLESAALYSIKWYRDDQEFYRYVPKEDPPRRTFHVDPPLDVDLSASGAHDVRLLRTTQAQSGVYKCEVTADAPLFHTDIRSTHVTITQIGSGGVILRPANILTAQNDPRYPAADCTAPPAYPAVNITWYVNGRQVLENLATINTVIKENVTSGLSQTHSELLGGALEEALPGTIRVRCEATLLDVYHDVAELNIEPPPPPLAPPAGPITGPTAPLGLSDSSQYSSAISTSSTSLCVFILIILCYLY